jgi:hypothetical protein
MNKGIIALIIILVIAVVAAGLYLTMQAPANNTTNISNQTNTTPVITNKTNTTNNTTISAARAKELALQYTGMGVTLGTPTLTTYKSVQVWSVPLYTSGQNQSTGYIYINAKTGARVQ